MSSQRAIRRMLSLMLALSVALWAESGLAMLAADHAAECRAQMFHTPQAHAMSCCPMHAASAPSRFFDPPPCCDLSNQPRPLAFLVTSGKSRSSQLSAGNTACVLLAPVQRSSAFLLVADTPPFVKPVFDKKTDLRI